MSTETRPPWDFKRGPLGFLTDPTAYVVRIYPAWKASPEIVFVPILRNGMEAGRWEGRFLTGEQYQQLLAAIRAVLEPAPVCEVRELPGEGEHSTASTAHPGATPEREVS